MKLYHVSTEIETNPIQFVPRVPESRMIGENTTIPRICFSTEIIKCLKSIPDSYDGLYNKYHLQQTMGIPALFTVFTTDFNDVEAHHILYPEELMNKGFVPDAIKQQEHWITKELHLSPSSLIWVEHLVQENDDTQFHEIRLQHAIESCDREFNFTFTGQDEVEEFKNLLLVCGLSHEEEVKKGTFSFAERIFEIKVRVPAGVDVSQLWIQYYVVRFQYEEELLLNDFQLLLAKSSPFNSPVLSS